MRLAAVVWECNFINEKDLKTPEKPMKWLVSGVFVIAVIKV